MLIKVLKASVLLPDVPFAWFDFAPGWGEPNGGVIGGSPLPFGVHVKEVLPGLIKGFVHDLAHDCWCNIVSLPSWVPGPFTRTAG